ncbi:MAG: PIG-L family deacetylase [Candidatus Omnitrophica bacterium]|nr:PIG-L family deacetylase [Candidatus Omnitrophota bacterium]
MIKKIAGKIFELFRNISLCPGLYLAEEPLGKKVLIIAPHPDDEVIGCSGALIKHLKRRDKVKIIFLSRNKLDEGPTEIGRIREKEARLVMEFLGVDSFEFVEHEDMRAALSGKGYSFLERIFRSFAPDTVYAPSFLEDHHEHRKAADLIARVFEKNPEITKGMKVFLYQIWGQTCPNFLLKVDSVFPATLEALGKYKSQLSNFNYIDMHKQLRLNWAGLAKGIGLYEAFFLCSGKELVRILSRKSKEITYRGLLAMPYAGVMALRKKLKP